MKKSSTNESVLHPIYVLHPICATSIYQSSDLSQLTNILLTNTVYVKENESK